MAADTVSNPDLDGLGSSDDNELLKNTAVRNGIDVGEPGFLLGPRENRNKLVGNLAKGNGDAGFFEGPVQGSDTDGNMYKANKALFNRFGGFESFRDNSTFKLNLAIKNTRVGFAAPGVASALKNIAVANDTNCDGAFAVGPPACITLWG